LGILFGHEKIKVVSWKLSTVKNWPDMNIFCGDFRVKNL
jgi:hypothetical protein